MRYSWLIAASLLVAPAVAQDVHPSFDCKKAKSPAEKLICSDAGLSELDLVLSRAYRDALQEGNVEKKSQLAWIRSRDVECASSRSKECLRASIERRIAQLQQPAAGYSVADHWPTGIHESLFDMSPEEAPICRALANAVNRSTAPMPLTPYHEPPLGGAGLVEASWQPVTDADPVEIIRELHRQMGVSAAVLFAPGWREGWEKKLAKGEARLEWTTLVGLRGDAPSTRVVRLMDDPAWLQQRKNVSSTMMAIVNGSFSNLQYIRMLDPADSAFTFQGRSYFFGISYRDVDDSFAVRLSEPQQDISVDKSYEGPGAGAPSAPAFVRICRLLFHKPKTKSP